MPRIRPVDTVWLFFLGALAALIVTKPEHSFYEWLVLIALGLLQATETHLGTRSDEVAAGLSVGVKLILCYWLVWETGGIESSYYLIFLLPILSAASIFGLGGTLLTTAGSSGLYLSLLWFVDLETYYVPPEAKQELTVRALFFLLTAILVNRLATENRRKTESLAEANRELRQAQADVQRSERLAALGQLSAGLAHEMRNPLGVISASAEILGKNVSKENEIAREVAELIRGEVGRTNSLVTRFLNFARPSPLRRELNDLNEVVERGLSHLSETFKDSAGQVEIKRDFGDLPKFLFDATLVESTVVNLLLNAQEAMPQGGVLKVTTARNGSMARLEVTDSGEGIAEDQLESIFNPFYTTKPTGVGLGLAIVSKFVDSHGGKISVVSTAGKGSTFRVLLPMGSAS